MKSSVVSLVLISILFNTNPTECQDWTAPVRNILSQATNGTTGAGNTIPTIMALNGVTLQQLQQQLNTIREKTKEIVNNLHQDIMKLDVKNLTHLTAVHEKYMRLFNKTYANPKEHQERFGHFQRAIEMIQKHNSNITVKYLKGINRLSDMSFAEILTKKLGLKQDEGEVVISKQYRVLKASAPVPQVASTPVPKTYCAPKNEEDTPDRDVMLQASAPVDVPKEWDWRSYGVVTPSKDQGTCNSCYCFAAATVLESHNMKRLIAEGKFDPKNQKQITVSQQNILDCSGDYGTDGCEGGMPQQAFRYVAANKGVNGADVYPYTGKKDKCAYNADNRLDVDVTDGQRLTSGKDEELVNAIYTYGPVAIAVHITEDLTAYKTGLFDDPKCSATEINHAVVAVGYTPEYFIVKNSWGPEWGEDGYVKISRRETNKCGVSQQAYYPIVPNAVDTQAMKDKLITV